MREKILTALKARFGALGVQDSLLERFATNIAVTVKNEDEIQAKVDEVQLMQLVQSEVDSRITEANKKAVENAKSKLIADAFAEKGLNVDGTPIKKPEGSENIPDYLKQFIADQKKAIEDLRGDLTAVRTKETKAEIKAKVVAQLKQLNVPEGYYNSVVIDLDDPEKVSETATKISNDFTLLKQEMVNQNLVFEKPQHSQQNVAESDITDYLDSKFGKSEEK